MSASRPGQLRVAYLVSKYPALSHTFIEREIDGLRGQGIDVVTFTVRPCPEGELSSSTMRSEATRTRPIIGAPKWHWARAHLGLMRRRGDVWWKGLRIALSTGRLEPRSRLWQLFYFGEAVVLYDYMRRDGLRHLHVHMANVAADVARLVTALGQAEDGPTGGWRWSLTIHGPGEFEMVEQWDVPAKLRAAQGVSVISDFGRSQLMRLVEPEHWAKMSKVRMTVEPTVFKGLSAERAHRSGPLRVLYVGRLVPQKGGPVLVDALALLSERGVDFTARLIGTGELLETLQRQISAAGLADRVHLVGPVGQDDILEQYAWADVFALPSFQEGLPVVLMEAMATELPVVTTRIAAVSELVEDHLSGRVVHAGRADLVADALTELADHPDRRLEMGKRGRQAVLAGFTPATASPAMAAFMREVQQA
ncbi:glycosyltransferase [Arsenicicoccus sp. MKL-02]|uniref:Glycosyltransferase n=1 Tax=Arsenicicoccus cauae TaxID=2663847 RepID=A0A6I3IEZ7_9MICO|nr:glycosyltransferase [Arsenicicoccus cauae]